MRLKGSQNNFREGKCDVTSNKYTDTIFISSSDPTSNKSSLANVFSDIGSYCRQSNI